MNCGEVFETDEKSVKFPCLFCGKETEGHPLSDICYTCGARVCAQCTFNNKRIKHYTFGGSHASSGEKMYCEFCKHAIPDTLKNALEYCDTEITNSMQRIDNLNRVIHDMREDLKASIKPLEKTNFIHNFFIE